MNSRYESARGSIRAVSAGAVAVALGTLLFGGCAIRPDSSPSNVPEDQRGVFGANVATGDEAAGTSLIFLVAPTDPDAPSQLRSVMRDVDNESAAVVRSLLSGPNATEQADNVSTALPADLEVLSRPRTLGRITTIDLNDALDALDPVELRLAIAQIVATATAVSGVDAVEIRVNGEPAVWPRGDGELTDQPLSTFDFPGIIESTQPAYPSFSPPS